MTDIVERLRNRAIAAMIIKDKADLFYDAVDEIERLRLELDMMQATILVPSQKDDRRTIERLRSQIESAEEAYVRLDAAMNNLKSIFRVNMLRAFPETSHEVIDAYISKALGETE